METQHIPVLLEEIMTGLQPESDDVVLDGTLGGGGHARALLEKLGSKGVLIGLDQDQEALHRNQDMLQNYEAQVTLIHENFAHVLDVWMANHLPSPNKILLDLGWSSDQFADESRGFSFRLNGPLDMRLDASKEGKLTASDLVNSLDVQQLHDIIKNYGEERYAYRIAREIVYQRTEHGPIETTSRLAEIIQEATPASYAKTKIHPATRTFQALRIAVNDELGVLERGLEGMLSVLAPGGTMAVISFHSLEDRIVKNCFRDWHQQNLGKNVTKKPITASDKEIKTNPRSRSAKLRIFIKDTTS